MLSPAMLKILPAWYRDGRAREKPNAGSPRAFGHYPTP